MKPYFKSFEEVVTVQSQALSINAPAPSLGTGVIRYWVCDPPHHHHHPQTFSLVPGIPAEPKLVDILRALT